MTPEERDAALYEAPFAYVTREVKPIRVGNREKQRESNWWRLGRPRPELRSHLVSLTRFIATVETSKHRLFVALPTSVGPKHRLIVIPREDDSTFGILQSRIHVCWALAKGGTLEDRPVYNTSQCFETFPFPAGLTPRDTAHQRTEVLADGAVIPAGLAPSPLAGEGGGEGWVTAQNQGGTASYVPPHPGAERDKRVAALPRGERGQNGATGQRKELRDHAISIARAAKRLNDLRERWLNPPEWTETVPEVIPLGMDKSPYPDRILARATLGAADLAELKKRTLTNLYNQRPAWLADAHATLDAAVAAAYGWADYSAATSDNEILARLLALNHERAAQA